MATKAARCSITYTNLVSVDEKEEDATVMSTKFVTRAPPVVLRVSLKQSVLNAALLEACSTGALTPAERAIRRGACVRMRNVEGTSAIGAAVSSGNRSLVKLLINEGADTCMPLVVRDPAAVGYTMLMIACNKGDHIMARMLLGMGAKTEEVGQQGFTALLLACKGGHDAVVRLLVAWGANVSDRTYHPTLPRRSNAAALYSRNNFLVGHFVEGVLLQPLAMAVSHGHQHVVESLIASGRLAPTEDLFNLCLAWAATENAGDMCLMLASIGADLGGGTVVPATRASPSGW